MCKLWRDVATTKSLWKEVFLDYKQKTFQRRINPSIRAFFTRYVGYSLEYLTIKSIDNDLLKHLQNFCPNLELLVLEDGDYTQCDFSLFPSSIGYLEISICDPKNRNYYPPNWYKSFTSEHFPNLDTLKIEGAPDIDRAIVQFSSMKSITDLHILDVSEISSDAFDTLMSMSWLEGLGLVAVTYLPLDYATKILRNLPKLRAVDFRVTHYLVTPEVLRKLAKLPELRRLMLPSCYKIMKTLCKVVLNMTELKFVEFDCDFQFGDPAPRNLIETLSTLQKLRPDVEYTFRDIKVVPDNYDAILNDACSGVEDGNEEEEGLDNDDDDDSDSDDSDDAD